MSRHEPLRGQPGNAGQFRQDDLSEQPDGTDALPGGERPGRGWFSPRAKTGLAIAGTTVGVLVVGVGAAVYALRNEELRGDAVDRARQTCADVTEPRAALRGKVGAAGALLSDTLGRVADESTRVELEAAVDEVRDLPSAKVTVDPKTSRSQAEEITAACESVFTGADKAEARLDAAMVAVSNSHTAWRQSPQGRALLELEAAVDEGEAALDAYGGKVVRGCLVSYADTPSRELSAALSGAHLWVGQYRPVSLDVAEMTAATVDVRAKTAVVAQLVAEGRAVPNVRVVYDHVERHVPLTERTVRQPTPPADSQPRGGSSLAP